MKTPFIALAFAVAATAATAQLASPISAGASPTVGADPAGTRPGRSRLRADRDKVKADKERLAAARAARDDDAIRAEKATLRADMAAWRADRERLADADSGESLKR